MPEGIDYNQVWNGKFYGTKECGVSLSLFGSQPYCGSQRGTIESQKSVMSKSRQARGLRLPKLYHNFVEIDWKEPQPDLTLYSVPRAFRRDILERFCDERRASHLRKDA